MNEEEMAVPEFGSEAQFHAAYRLVKDPVCLFNPETGVVVAGNATFWQQWKDSFETGTAFGLEVLASRKKQEWEVALIRGGKVEQTLWLQAGSALLKGDALKLGVGKALSTDSLCEEKRADEADKKVLLNEVYHRVKNNLNIIVSLLSLQINRISNPETRLLLLESKSRVFTLSLLQQNLYSSSRISEIKAATYLHALARSVLSTFGPKEKQINLKAELEECWLDIDTLTPLGLIAHELLSNAARHAFTDRENGEIRVAFNQQKEGAFELRVKDNGCGLSQQSVAGEFDYDTLGFQLVKSLCKQLNAELKVESNSMHGTYVTVVFKRRIT